MYALPKLNFNYEDLEPVVDSKTVEIHYSKHHQTYLDKLNKAIENLPELQNLPIEQLITLDAVPEEIKIPVRNNGGGYFNHNFYWAQFQKPQSNIVLPTNIDTLIKYKYQSFENFQTEFNNNAVSLFGSGWTWLIINNKNELEIINTPNQDNPIFLKLGKPLLCIDLWEHAYYLKYQNRRVEYITEWWKIIDWNFVEEQL